MASPFPRALPALAWANVALHAAGLAIAWFGMRPGAVVTPLAERMAFLAGRPAAWCLGWGTWMLCSLLLVSFMALLSRSLPGRPAAARLALIVTSAGMATDLLCDVVQVQVLPTTALAGQASLFLAYERFAFIGGVTVANGLYTSGILLMNSCLKGPARLAGWATAAAGFSLATAGFIPSPALLQGATGATMVFYSLWTVLAARDLAGLGEHGP